MTAGRILYFDCFSGISGDMLLGALIDAGLPLDDLRRALGSLAVEDLEVSARKVLRAGVSATKFVVGPQQDHSHDQHHDQDRSHPHSHDHAESHAHHHHHDSHPHRSLKDIFTLIDRSGLSDSGRARAKSLFQRLAEAEAAIHQMPIGQVHLHEVGALDSIADIVGAVYGLEWVGAERVVCSPLNVGGGMVKSAHGVFPVPAPATVRLLGDAPVYSGSAKFETVTPTGALLATDYAQEYGGIPPMAVERVGYGAGERDHHETPNVLRILIGRASADIPHERVVVLECEIDDMNPQLFGVAMEKLQAAGALDVFYVPAQMKKNRPGTLLTVVAPPSLRDAMTEIVFRETTTIGVRVSEVERACLERELVEVATPVGAIRFKVARYRGRLMNAAPEFDDCVRAAEVHGRSVKEVQAIAIEAFGANRSRLS